MNRISLTTLGSLVTAALLTISSGCELISAPDRSKIGANGGGGGGTTDGGGGAGADGTTNGGAGGAGGGTPCTTPEDCSPPAGDCVVAVCDAGTCGQAPVPAGTPVPTQTGGDCQVRQCDGDGGVESVEDAADLPVDGLECTADVCDAGAPSNPPVAAGTACTEGGGVLCDDAGACVECLLPTECPGADDACQTRTCTSGGCGFSFTAANTPVAGQTAGDCKVLVCDGAGKVTTANDDADLPDDNNPCTIGACSMGAAQLTNVTAGTPCGAALVCDGAGQCVGCGVASDCPGADDECKTRTCTASVCGFSFTAANTAVRAQTAGDCKQDVCDGSGNVVAINADTDTPQDDGNPCTSQACSNGSPTFPPVAVNTACNQNGGSFCSPAGQCVQCNQASQCPGTEGDCQALTCVANTCGVSFAPPGTATSSQTPGDCKQNQCDGSGGVVSVNLNTDVPVDGNSCTADVCTNGVPSNPPVAVDTACNQNGGSFCSAAGQCVQCNQPSQCPGTDTDCQSRTCAANACGVSFQPGGFVTPVQTAGDCKQDQCDGSGGVVSVNLNTDVPVDGNSCTADVCTNGLPSNPPQPAGTPCNQGGGTICDGAGLCVAPGCDDGIQNGTETGVDCGGGACPACANGQGCAAGADCASNVCDTSGGPGVCVQCVSAAQCPANGECETATCAANVCGLSPKAAGTVTAAQTPGDCKQNECDGAGNIVAATLDTDLPVDGNPCTGDVCAAGVPSNPPSAVDTVCAQNGGVVCDGASNCIQPIMVLRVGDGAAALSNAATATFIEVRTPAGALLAKPGNPVPLPTAVSGADQPLTLSGTATSEGALSRSANGSFVTLAGYGAAPGTANVASSASMTVHRIVGRINKSLAIDTTTRLNAAFSGNNVRGATSDNGAQFWVSGTAAANGGVQYTTLGELGSTQVLGTPSNVRGVHIFGGQLYGSSGSTPFTNVFTVGTGLPTMPGAAATALPGLPTTTASPYSFVLFDLNPGVAGDDVLYIADDRSVANGGGVQKWTFDGATWTLVATLANGLPSGVRGLAGYLSAPGTVTLFATTTQASANQLVMVVDTGAAAPAFTTLATAPTNTAYRGVALAPN